VKPRKRVVIAGGGVTGLVAAYHLREKAVEAGLDIECIVLEKDVRLGGKIVTEQQDGFLFEGGPDCFVREKPSVVALCERIGIADRLLASNDSSTGTFVLNNGKLHALPDGMMLLVPTKMVPFALSPLISLPGKLRMGMDLLLPRRKSSTDESLASFVRRRLGQEALDKIGDPLIGGIHGNNPETMSLLASFPRLLKMEQDHRSLIIAMLAARRRAPKPPTTSTGATRKTYFMSFKGGMADLINGLVAALGSVSLRTGTAVTGIEKGVAGYRVHMDAGETIDADAVVVATPAWDASSLLRGLDATIAGKLSEIPQASSATVNLVFRRADVPGPLASFGFVISAAEKRLINALTFSSVKWQSRVPDERYVSVRTFVGGSRNQDLAMRSDDELVRIARDELASILGISGEPVHSRVHHWINARPQYVLGHTDRVAAIEERLATLFPGLALAGASYRGVGVPDCINDGIRAAERIYGYFDGSSFPTHTATGN